MDVIRTQKLLDSILFNANTRPFTIHTWTQAHKTMYRDSGSLQHIFLGELVQTTTQKAETAGLSNTRVGSPLHQAT